MRGAFLKRKKKSDLSVRFFLEFRFFVENKFIKNIQIYALFFNFVMIHITQNIVEPNQSNYEFWSLLISWFTWILTIFFAAKSYFLEKKIWNLNIFNGTARITRMKVHPSQDTYLRIMFTNTSNVMGIIDNICIEIEPICYWERLFTKIKKISSHNEDIYNYRIPIWKNFPRQSIFGIDNEYPPYTVPPKESRIIYIPYQEFCKDMNQDLKENRSRIKQFIFLTSDEKRIGAKISKKSFPGLIFTKKDLLNEKNL